MGSKAFMVLVGCIVAAATGEEIDFSSLWATEGRPRSCKRGTTKILAKERQDHVETPFIDAFDRMEQ